MREAQRLAIGTVGSNRCERDNRTARSEWIEPPSKRDRKGIERDRQREGREKEQERERERERKKEKERAERTQRSEPPLLLSLSTPPSSLYFFLCSME